MASRRAAQDDTTLKEELPMAGFAALATAFATGTAVLIAALAKERRLPRHWSAIDLVATGVATHRLARIVTRDRVAMPFRAPFAEYQGSAGAGEVNERPRGHGLRRAIGSLVTCPFCVSPWIATAFLGAKAARPGAARFVEGMLVSVTVADFVQQLYTAARKLA
jgi:hypothetical protein